MILGLALLLVGGAAAFVVRSPEQALAVVRRLSVQRPDFLKIWFSPARGMSLPREFNWIRAAIREAAMLSQTRTVSMPDCDNSQAVRRAPCSSGRVSSAYT